MSFNIPPLSKYVQPFQKLMTIFLHNRKCQYKFLTSTFLRTINQPIQCTDIPNVLTMLILNKSISVIHYQVSLPTACNQNRKGLKCCSKIGGKLD